MFFAPIQASGRLLLVIEDLISRIQFNVNMLKTKLKNFESVSVGITMGKVSFVLDNDENDKIKIDIGSNLSKVCRIIST